MGAKETLSTRHLRAAKRLQKVAEPKVFKYGLVKCAEIISGKFGVSGQTVINYVSGRCNDGYMTEALTKEFENLHINTN